MLNQPIKQRSSYLTQHLMARIPALVEQGLNAEAIAARLGCKVRRLRVRCSRAGISLHVSKKVKGVPLVPAVQLSRVAMSRLRQRAKAIGVNEAELASDLLEMIAQMAVAVQQRSLGN